MVKECGDRTYGYDCKNKCTGNCQNGAPCDKENGNCLNGCNPGYTYDNCSEGTI